MQVTKTSGGYTVQTENGIFVAWYDRTIRLWSAYRADEDGAQLAPAGYGTSRDEAVADATWQPLD